MKKQLRIKLKHPTRKMRLGRHEVTHIATTFDLNEAELSELDNKGPKHWIEVKEAKKAEVKKPKKKKEEK